jgi:NAD(P)-dependent dehydrogenase (short-subunit alcohol dehydrogenase family)
MRLTGKVALVTGAADVRSIGFGMAQALADEGADVVVNDVAAPDELEQRAEELIAKGRRALALQADVTDAYQVKQMVKQTVEKLGRLDIVCSNAGIIRWEPVLEITPRQMQAILNVNLMGNVLVCQAAAQQMIAQGDGGRIIITSSVQSDLQFPVTPVYGGTKFAMHTFVGCLALELAEHNITVNHIGPGWVRSALNDAAPDQQTSADIERQKAGVPLGHRPGLPYEMGRAAVYFASPDGDYVTGAFIRLDGGLALGK